MRSLSVSAVSSTSCSNITRTPRFFSWFKASRISTVSRPNLLIFLLSIISILLDLQSFSIRLNSLREEPVLLEAISIYTSTNNHLGLTAVILVSAETWAVRFSTGQQCLYSHDSKFLRAFLVSEAMVEYSVFFYCQPR